MTLTGLLVTPPELAVKVAEQVKLVPTLVPPKLRGMNAIPFASVLAVEGKGGLVTKGEQVLDVLVNVTITLASGLPDISRAVAVRVTIGFTDKDTDGGFTAKFIDAGGGGTILIVTELLEIVPAELWADARKVTVQAVLVPVSTLMGPVVATPDALVVLIMGKDGEVTNVPQVRALVLKFTPALGTRLPAESVTVAVSVKVSPILTVVLSTSNFIPWAIGIGVGVNVPGPVTSTLTVTLLVKVFPLITVLAVTTISVLLVTGGIVRVAVA